MVRIRLRRTGKRGQPSYRVVVADRESPRDGRFIESIGHYNPRTDPPTVVLDDDRALYWLSQGAQPSEAVARLLRNKGILARFEVIKSGAPDPGPLVETEEAEPEAAAEEAEPEAPAGAEEAEPEAAAEEAEAETPASAVEAEPKATAEVEPVAAAEASDAAEAPAATEASGKADASGKAEGAEAGEAEPSAEED